DRRGDGWLFTVEIEKKPKTLTWKMNSLSSFLQITEKRASRIYLNVHTCSLKVGHSAMEGTTGVEGRPPHPCSPFRVCGGFHRPSSRKQSTAHLAQLLQFRSLLYSPAANALFLLR